MKKLKNPTGILLQHKISDDAPPDLGNQILIHGIFFVCLFFVAFAFIEISMTALELNYHRPVVLIWLFIFTLMFTLLFVFVAKIDYIFPVIIVLYLIAGWYWREPLIEGVKAIFSAVSYAFVTAHGTYFEYKLEYDIEALTATLLYASFGISAIYHSFLHILSDTKIIYILSGFEIILLLLLIKAPAMPSIVLFLISSLFLYLLFNMRKTGRILPNLAVQKQVFTFFALFTVIAFITSLLVAFFIPVKEDDLLEARTHALETFRDTFLYSARDNNGLMNGNGMAGLSDGDLTNVGNTRYSGETHLQVTLDHKPDTSIYLSAYLGQDYLGTSWTTHYDMAEDYYASSYLISQFTMEERKSIQVQNLKGNAYDLVPYSSEIMDTQWVGDGTQEDTEYIWYDYLYYPAFYKWALTDRTQLYLLADNDLGYYDTASIEAAYLTVPDHLERLKDTYYNPELTDTESVISYVVDTLKTSNTYTLTPGYVPPEEDFAEYFLFESKQGFCTHYATAGTLMFRVNGIPARFVGGYMVSPSDFKPQEDGTYLAEVPDSRAHAWVEIYIDQVGWIPVEVTYSNTNGALAEPSETPFSNPETKDKEQNKPKQNSKIIRLSYPLLIAVGLLAALLLFFVLRRFVLIYLKKNKFNSEEAAPCISFLSGEMKKVHKSAGLIQASAESQSAFARRAEEFYDSLEPGHYKLYTDILLKATFSPYQITDSELAYVKSTYQDLSAAIYAQLPFYRKFKFYWIDCLLLIQKES